MMASASLLVLLALQQATLIFTERYGAAFEEAKIRNVPVLIMDFDGWDGDLVGAFSQFAKDKGLIRAANLAVLIGSSQYVQGEKKQIVEGEERTVCKLFDSVSPGRAERMKAEVFRDFAVDGILKSPLFLVAFPDKKVYERMLEETEPSAVTSSLVRCQKKMGPGMPRSDYVTMVRGLERLQRMVAQKDWSQAVPVAEQLLQIPGSFPPHEQLKGLVARIQEEEQRLLAAAEQLWQDGKHWESLVELDRVKSQFGTGQGARQAAEQLKVRAATVEGKSLAARLKAHQQARAMYQEALDLERAGDVRKSLQKLHKVVQQFPDSEFGGRAQGLIPALEEQVKKAGAKSTVGDQGQKPDKKP